MGKVVKIFLNQAYIPIDKKLFKVGTCIDFDCYIQRFNGYVIIIEAGTFLDDKLFHKITSNKLQIYIEKKDYDEYKNYAHENKIKSDEASQNLSLKIEVKNTLDADKLLCKVKCSSEKLKILYYVGRNLINAWLLEENAKIAPVEAVENLIENIVEIIDEEDITLSCFNKFVDNNYTLATHSLNVTLFTSLIGKKLGLDYFDQKKLLLSAIFHDIGKTEIDESLLDKPDLLTDKEFDLVKQHSLDSVKIVKKAGIKDRLILDGIKHHHERLDGSGYPDGLKIKRISEFGQILAVCDVFDALITVKPYRGAYSTFNALKLMRKEYKDRLNVKYINIFIKLLN